MAKNPANLKRRRRVSLVMLTLALAITATLSFSMTNCESTAASSTVRVNLAGTPFTLEVAADNETRYKGLSERKSIEDDGGMIFVFTQPLALNFVMRDCFMDIDIIYLDAMGTVVRTHAMKMEAPRGPGEGTVGIQNAAYDARLKKWASGRRSQFVIEIQAGFVAKLGVKPGDQIDLDLKKLKRGAK